MEHYNTWSRTCGHVQVVHLVDMGTWGVDTHPIHRGVSWSLIPEQNSKIKTKSIIPMCPIHDTLRECCSCVAARQYKTLPVIHAITAWTALPVKCHNALFNAVSVLHLQYQDPAEPWLRVCVRSILGWRPSCELCPILQLAQNHIQFKQFCQQCFSRKGTVCPLYCIVRPGQGQGHVMHDNNLFVKRGACFPPRLAVCSAG